MKTCIIIGGGIGGLVTGALLTKEGYQVTVLEKNTIIGGGLQTFKRRDARFPTGMHIFGGFQEGGSQRKIFEYLGIMDKISLREMDEDACDVVTIAEDNAVYRLPKGKEKFIAYLSSVFPEEKEGIRAYINRLYEITEEVDLFYLHETQPYGLTNVSDDFNIPFDKLMDRYLTNPKLKGLLTYLCPLYGGVKGDSPVFMHALLAVLHINGTCQFVGESQQMANALKDVIEDAGGKVLSHIEVVRIKVEDHQVTGVVTKDEETYCADYYISDVHPEVLLRLVDDGAFPKVFKQRVSSVSESTSSFNVFVKLKSKTFPYLNQGHYYFENYAEGFDTSKVQEEKWPRGIFYLTPPVQHQDDFAETMVFIAPMDFDYVRPWEDTQLGHRGESYKMWKQAMTNRILDRMEKVYPNLRDSIEYCTASSPLTIRDYYGNRRGSCYGFQKNSGDLMLSQMSVFTKVKNLFLTGQNVNIHGLCGVSLTAIETAEALVGQNVIVRKINNCCENHI